MVKKKQKVLFTIAWTRSRKTKVTKKFFQRFTVITLALLIALPIGWLSGLLPFTYNMIRCGRLPVESTKFMASFTYKVPGDEGYGIHPFSEYGYCTQSEIQATNGYRRSTSTTAGKKEEADIWAKIREEQEFSLSKLDYKFYTPKLEGYSISNLRVNLIKGNVHSFYTVMKDGKSIGQIRELKKSDSYNICSSDDQSKRYCKVIGRDSKGREVNREYTNSRKGWKSYYTGINIGGTGIIFATNDNQEAIKVFGAMAPFAK
ncbi:MAG TPA: hypothetical protein VGE34_03325 [Candidatus Saccharimonadales bacterium]